MAKSQNNYDLPVEGDSGNEIFSQTSMSEDSSSNDEVFTVTQVKKVYSKTKTMKKSTPRTSRFGSEKEQRPKPTPNRKDKNLASKATGSSKRITKPKTKHEDNVPSSSYGFRSMANERKRKIRPVSSSSDDDYQRPPNRSSTPKKKQSKPSYPNVLYFWTIFDKIDDYLKDS